MLLFFLIFGIVAVSYFKGTFFYCYTDGARLGQPTFDDDFDLLNKWDCLNAGAEWVNKFYNFDSIEMAMITLFVMCNVTSWQEYMYISAQITEIDYAWQKWTH